VKMVRHYRVTLLIFDCGMLTFRVQEQDKLKLIKPASKPKAPVKSGHTLMIITLQ